MTRELLEYQVRFVTPAFLGNAEQEGQWRTPPFKALLRQWWRVVYAADHSFSVDVIKMREEEGGLFGSVHSAEPRQSQVRLRLSDWTTSRTESIKNPSEHQRYLGYGRVDKPHKTIGVGDNECRKLFISVLRSDASSIEQSMALISAYGTIGGRSRNGWGSLRIEACEPSQSQIDLSKYQRPWEDALKLNWPHALGTSEEGALTWITTRPLGSWNKAMNQLGKIRKDLRRSFKSEQDRNWLAGAGNIRLPNSLRFKVRKDEEGMYGAIFHMPCLPVQELNPDINIIRGIWGKAHGFLDDCPSLKRIAQ